MALCALTLAAAGCGSGGGGQLSKADYKAALAKIVKEVNAGHQSVQKAELSATSTSEVISVLRNFANSENHIGDEVAKLKAPSDAASANALLAKGEHDDAAEILGLLPKLTHYSTPQELFAYLRTIPQPTGGREEDNAVFKLQQLGYSSGS